MVGVENKINFNWMVMKKRLLSLMIWGMLFYAGCSSSVREDAGDAIRISTRDCMIKENMKSSEYLRRVKYVPLETDSVCILGNIDKIKYKDGILFINDRENGMYAFDTTGHFLNRIGAKGRGPEEYLTATAFYIDPEKKHVVVVDGGNYRALAYSFDGQFVGAEAIGKAAAFQVQDLECQDGHLLLNYRLPFAYKKQLYAYEVYDTNWLLLDTFSLYAPYLKAGGASMTYASAPMVKTDEGILFITPFSDLVYEFAGDSIRVKYQVETLKPLVTDQQLSLMGKTYFDIREKLADGNYTSGIRGIVQAGKYCIWDIHCNQPYTVVWDQEKRKGMYIMDYWDEDFDVYSQGISTYLTIAVEDGLLSVLPFLSEERRKKLIESSKNAALVQVLEELKEGDNPLLMFYDLKEIE